MNLDRASFKSMLQDVLLNENQKKDSELLDITLVEVLNLFPIQPITLTTYNSDGGAGIILKPEDSPEIQDAPEIQARLEYLPQHDTWCLLFFRPGFKNPHETYTGNCDSEHKSFKTLIETLTKFCWD